MTIYPFSQILLLAFAAQQDFSVLDGAQMDALHEQRVQWMMVRQPEPSPGIYQDFRVAASLEGVLPFRVQELARAASVQVLLTPREPRIHNGVLWMVPPPGLKLPAPPDRFAGFEPSGKDLKKLQSAFKQRPTEVAGLTGGSPLAKWFKLESDQVPFAPVILHVLAKELTEADVRAGLEAKRTYEAAEWLCDSKGFGFWASNNQGVFDIGDRFAMQRNTQFEVRVPVAAALRLLRDGQVVKEEANARTLRFAANEPGSYRVEADLEAAGSKHSWIRTEAIHMSPQAPFQLPSFATEDPTVEITRAIPYVTGSQDAKQRLDLYLPKGKSNFPVLLFLHGGGWSTGDRSIYGPIGVMFAKKGIGVAIPSYRLMPANPHPAQIDDAAAAFAWVAKNIGTRGADLNRIFIGGHSAGAHLAALLALKPEYQARYEIPAGTIKGVAAMSGAYDLKMLPMFGSPEARRLASPLEFVNKNAPPFLVSYCQWDYLSLPFQAKQFAAELKKQFIPTRLLYVPGETHITEVISMLKDGDPTTEAVFRLIETGQP